MPWTTSNYPPSMKNLDSKTRKKAIEIANALLEDGSDEGRAIAIATAQAQRWAGHGEPAKNHYHVKPHERGWSVELGDSKRASAIFNNKFEAQKRALELAHDRGVFVIVHASNGDVEESIAPD